MHFCTFSALSIQHGVFSKLILRPEKLEKSDNTLSVSFNKLLVPSKRNNVSSAYYDSLCSLLLIIMPFIFLFFLIIIPKISTQRINKNYAG